MNCPKCNVQLGIMEREGHIGFCCAQCSGVLLTERYINTLKYKPNVSVNNFYTDIRSGLTVRSISQCPSCNEAMYIANYNNTELDFCPGCNAIWFDFNKLCSAVTKQRSELVGAPTYTKSDIGLFVVEFVVGLFSNLR